MDTSQVNFNHALAAFNNGQFEVATREIDRALTSDPQHPDVLHLAALIKKATFSYVHSEGYFRDSLTISPQQPVVLSNLANLLKVMGRFADANKAYLDAIDMMPDFGEAWLNRGLLAKEMLDWDVAKTCIAQAFKIKREPSIFSRLLELYLETKDIESLVSQSVAFQAEYPTLSDGYIFQAKGLVLKADTFGARAVLVAALSLVDDKARIEYELGLQHYVLEDFAIAEKHLRQAIDISPEFMDAHRSLNELYFQTGNENFLESYSNALVKLPSSELLLHNLAANQASGGYTDQAIDTLKYAIHLIGDTGFLSHGLGALLVRLGELDKARPLFELAMERDPANVRFILDRVSLDVKMDRQDTSQEFINRALSLQPYNQETWAYQGLVWRLNGDSKYDWLYDYDTFVRSYTLPVPQGFSSLSAFMEELSQYLSTLHVFTKQPLDQSVVQGTQTMGVLLEDPNMLVQAFKCSLMECIDAYLQALPNDASHPFLCRVGDGYDFSGSWSVKLKKSGHHSNHVHPFGWLSCCSYISIPDMSQSQAGWIKFGETSLNLGSREFIAKTVRPESGKCIFFPSYFWHGTLPLESDHSRIAIPCDIDPVLYLGSQ